MIYIILILLIFSAIFLFVYPFKIIIHNESNYLYVNISNLLVFKLNLLAILDKIKNEGIGDSNKANSVIKKLKLKKLEIRLTGINFDYQVNGLYYGLLCAIAGFFKTFFDAKNIEFNYDLNYLGDESVQFKSIVRAKVYSVIGAINNI